MCVWVGRGEKVEGGCVHVCVKEKEDKMEGSGGGNEIRKLHVRT